MIELILVGCYGIFKTYPILKNNNNVENRLRIKFRVRARHTYDDDMYVVISLVW